jgi:putative hydrolase of the HAD superfamily
MILKSDKINAIIFDLGGVIVDLAVDKTVKAFADLSGMAPEQIQRAYVKNPGFFAYERGLISDAEFRLMLRELFSIQVTDAQLDEGWNAMLVDLPAKKLQWLLNLKNKIQVYALSNTNSIHITHVNEMMLKGEPLDTYFHRCYYSHQVNMRKPDLEIYEHVLSHAGLIPNETLFLDDNPDNIKAAKALGIQAVQVEHPDEVYTLVNWL